jgi:hypothetical protein
MISSAKRGAVFPTLSTCGNKLNSLSGSG